jgi:Vacuolar sorting-associated protein 13, N-terminal
VHCTTCVHVKVLAIADMGILDLMLLHVACMQDDVNVPGCPLAVGFTLEKLSAHTIDEAGKEVFVHKNALELLRKVSCCISNAIVTAGMTVA